MVWHPLWWRAGRWCVLFLPPVLLARLVFLTHPDWTAFARMTRTISPVFGYLFAVGIGLLLLPVPDGDLVVSSRSELCRWQILSIAGGWLMGAYAIACAFCLGYGLKMGLGVWFLAAGVSLCVITMPLFFRIPWRSLIAVALVVAVILLGVR